MEVNCAAIYQALTVRFHQSRAVHGRELAVNGDVDTVVHGAAGLPWYPTMGSQSLEEVVRRSSIGLRMNAADSRQIRYVNVGRINWTARARRAPIWKIRGLVP